MALQHELFAFLTSQPEIVAVLGTRIYPVVIPAGKLVPKGAEVREVEQDKPALTWRLTRSPQEPDLDGEELMSVSLELTIWAQTYEEADGAATTVSTDLRTLATASPTVIGPLCPVTMVLQREEDVFDEELLLYGRQQMWELVGTNL